jgi:hypothetical protein
MKPSLMIDWIGSILLQAWIRLCMNRDTEYDQCCADKNLLHKNGFLSIILKINDDKQLNSKDYL